MLSNEKLLPDHELRIRYSSCLFELFATVLMFILTYKHLDLEILL